MVVYQNQKEREAKMEKKERENDHIERKNE